MMKTATNNLVMVITTNGREIFRDAYGMTDFLGRPRSVEEFLAGLVSAGCKMDGTNAVVWGDEKVTHRISVVAA
jgi:hypothetical protein